MFYNHQIVMLSTEKTSQIAVHNKLGLITARSQGWDHIVKYDYIQPMHLFVLSNEEIAEGYEGYAIVTVKDDPRIHYFVDVVVTEDNQCYTKGDRKYKFEFYSVKRIISTTDADLKLPLIPEEFVEVFVNNKDSIDMVAVEYKKALIGWEDEEDEDGRYQTPIHIEIPVVKFDNTLVIQKITKENYTREEVIKLCQSAYDCGGEISDSTEMPFKSFDEWIEENI